MICLALRGFLLPVKKINYFRAHNLVPMAVISNENSSKIKGRSCSKNSEYILLCLVLSGVVGCMKREYVEEGTNKEVAEEHQKLNGNVIIPQNRDGGPKDRLKGGSTSAALTTDRTTLGKAENIYRSQSRSSKDQPNGRSTNGGITRKLNKLEEFLSSLEKIISVAKKRASNNMTDEEKDTTDNTIQSAEGVWREYKELDEDNSTIDSVTEAIEKVRQAFNGLVDWGNKNKKFKPEVSPRKEPHNTQSPPRRATPSLEDQDVTPRITNVSPAGSGQSDVTPRITNVSPAGSGQSKDGENGAAPQANDGAGNDALTLPQLTDTSQDSNGPKEGAGTQDMPAAPSQSSDEISQNK